MIRKLKVVTALSAFHSFYGAMSRVNKEVDWKAYRTKSGKEYWVIEVV